MKTQFRKGSGPRKARSEGQKRRRNLRRHFPGEMQAHKVKRARRRGKCEKRQAVRAAWWENLKKLLASEKEAEAKEKARREEAKAKASGTNDLRVAADVKKS